jgi:hypothetical protein
VKRILLMMLLPLVLVGGAIAPTEVRCFRSQPSCLEQLIGEDNRYVPRPTTWLSAKQLRQLRNSPSGAHVGRMGAAQIRRLLTALNDE